MEKKESNSKRNRIFVIIAVAMLLVLVINIIVINRIAMSQVEQVGRIRVQGIASNLQQYLTEAESALDRAGVSLEKLLESDASEKEIRQFLLRQRDSEYDLSDGLCLNLFCAVDGKVMISGMETPEDYVLQDRAWYKGLLATPKGDVYISPTYDDAFTDNMCFTVAKFLDDGTNMIGLDYNTAAIQEYVSTLASEGYEESLIVDSNEEIVGCSRPDVVGEKLSTALPEYRNIFLRMNISDDSTMVSRIRRGKSRVAVFVSRTDNGWYMMCAIDSGTLYQNSYRRLLIVCAAAFVLIVLVLIVYLFMTRKGKKTGEKEKEEKRKKKEKSPGRWKEIRLFGKGKKEQDGDGETDFTIVTQKKYQYGITAIFCVTMFITIFICVRMSISDSQIKMEQELSRYNYEVGDWVLEQRSILDMFENVVVAKPDLLDNYEGMVKFLDDITKHYPKISATYIANPDFEHGHPMVMNNGWVPDEDYVEEERVWYTGALTAENFNITEPYFDARTGEYCITFSKVVQSENGEFYGVFAIDFYLDVLTDILKGSYTEEGYAFLVDKDGRIIDHPNSQYEFSDDSSPNIHELVYDCFYDEDGMVSFDDYDGTYRVGDSIEEKESGFRIIVVKNWWSIYGNVLEYALLFLILFGMCIFAVNVVMKKMIRWQWTANENLKKTADAAIRAEQAKSLFLSNMSHEIRTPINAVLGMNEMILRESKDEQMLSYAENIQSAGKTLLFLINDILDMSKIESGKMEIVPVEYKLGRLILDLWNVIGLRAQEKGLGISFNLDSEMPSGLYGDDVRIKQIVTNLLTNAVKYTPQGSVEMSVSCQPKGDEELLLVISVKDTGMGIKEEDLGKLFEKFQRLDEEKNRNIEGTGLGMNITMSLLELMGGEMKVDSVYQEGSVFTVIIPQKIVDREPLGDFETLRTQITHGDNEDRQIFEAPDATVLVVDDNEMNLVVFQALLKRTKVNIVTASSGKECLELVQQEKYNIIFMDHMMPEMDGIETLHKLREITDGPNTDTPVIALTANAIVGAKEMYLSEGFEDFLTKPIEGELLEQMVQKYLPEELLVFVSEEEAQAAEAEADTGASGEGGSESSPEDALIDEVEELYQSEGISIKQGMGYVGNKMDVYLELMEMFIKEKEKKEQMIIGFLLEENMADYGVLTHALKGNARTLGASRLADMAFEHEKAGKSGDLAYAQEHWEELAQEWAKCKKNFESMYQMLGGETEEKYAAVTDGEIREIAQEELDEVVDLLDRFQTDDATERLKEWLGSPLQPEMYEKIKNALLAIEEEYDEDKAMDILKE